MPESTIFSDIAAERTRQDEKWGPPAALPNGTGPNELCAVDLSGQPYKRVRDALQQMTDEAMVSGENTFANTLLEEVYEALAEEAPDRLRTELVQVAAVAVKWISVLDRRSA